MCLPSSTTTHPWRRIALLLLAAGGLNGALFAGEPTTSYNYDVRPVLAAKCFACHGSDAAKRKGKLRLDERAAAIEKQAIVPGNPEASELIKRLLTSDPEEIMPPPEKHNPVSDSERELLIRWIKEGAKYEAHWAFIPPVQRRSMLFFVTWRQHPSRARSAHPQGVPPLHQPPMPTKPWSTAS